MSNRFHKLNVGGISFVLRNIFRIILQQELTKKIGRTRGRTS